MALTQGQSRFLRFVAAGVANTLFGFAAYSGLIVAGTPVWLALFVAMLFGMMFNFFSTGGFVFGNRDLKRIPRFVICYGVIYAANLASVEAVMACCAPGRKIIAQAIVTLPASLLSYYLLKTFVFAGAKPPGSGGE